MSYFFYYECSYRSADGDILTHIGQTRYIGVPNKTNALKTVISSLPEFVRNNRVVLMIKGMGNPVQILH